MSTGTCRSHLGSTDRSSGPPSLGFALRYKPRRTSTISQSKIYSGYWSISISLMSTHFSHCSIDRLSRAMFHMDFISGTAGLVVLFLLYVHWDHDTPTIRECSFLVHQMWHRPGGRGSSKFSLYGILALLQRVSTKFNPTVYVSDRSLHGYNT